MSVERLSVAEAAKALGVTRDAIHKRINRGTIEHEKGEDGRFYVFVDTSTEGLELSTDISVDKSKVEALERLIDSQHDRRASLERELDRRGDETTRLHQIVAGLTQANAQLSARVPELEAPQETTDAAGTVEEAPDSAEPPAPRREVLRKAHGGPGGVECWDGSVDEKSLQLLKVIREQLGKPTQVVPWTRGLRRAVLAWTPEPSNAACSIWSGPDT